jgi:hypothetical protein
MFVARTFRSIVNLVLLIAALASMGSLAEMTYDLAVNAGQESKRGFLSISKLNAQLLSPKVER